ncbi:MAG: D-aminoacylase [Proteobacteria bacterium]|nr:MAG: D-aminoacylase [Pseudomonadota bacterium]
MLDLRIVNGLVVDGTGSPALRADVGIRDGRIVSVGTVDEPARETFDAAGAIVAPGFVDVHTHYDGQASWDGDMLPSSVHGVTTAVMGNCGVGFAPCRPRDHERLIRLFEGVEDIPGTALAEGIRWNWETFDEYLTALEETPRTMDVAAYLTHDAVRVYAMGDRAVADTPATEEDIAQMAEIVRGAMRAGAVGESGRGILQAVSDFDMEVGDEHFEREFDVLERFAEASGGRPLSISLMQRDKNPTQWQDILRRSEAAVAKGIDIRMQVAPRGIGVLLGLEATFHPFIGFPSYKAVAHLSLAERVAHLRTPEVKARILGETSDKVAGDGSAIPPLADRLLGMIEMVSARMFPLGRRPDYEPKLGDSIRAQAMARGIPPLEALYDALLEDDGRALLYFPIFNYAGMNLDAVGTMLHHPLAIPALADGGAHCGTICDASMPTFFLMHWVRDRAEARFTLERAVELLTRVPAEFAGFTDRGRIAPGLRADLTIFDLEKLELEAPRLVQDLPAGGQRFLQDAHGYLATFVHGVQVAKNGRLTDARPGRVVRLGR